MDLLQEKETLLAALPRLHTTPLGLTRLRRNLCLSEDTDPVAFCRDLLSREDCTVLHLGKNLYCRAENVLLTIHARIYTLITGRRIPVGKHHWKKWDLSLMLVWIFTMHTSLTA